MTKQGIGSEEMSLSAISNKEIYYSINITDEFGKNNEFSCVGCKSKMIFHRNIAGVKVQHFVHKVPCPFETEPETQEHIRMKNWCYNNLAADKKYLPDSIMVGDQKPDVLLEINGKQVAIECQCSKLSYEKWESRTRKYSLKGIYVLWLFGKKWYKRHFDHEKRVSEIEKELSELNGNVVYYAHEADEEEERKDKEDSFTVFPTRFEDVIRENWWTGEDVILKSTKKMNSAFPVSAEDSPNPQKGISLKLVETRNYKLVKFTHCYWDPNE